MLYIPGKLMFIAVVISRACSKADKVVTDSCLNDIVHTINMNDECKTEFQQRLFKIQY